MILTDGYHNGEPVYCTVNGWDCPYATDKCLCKLPYPYLDCDGFAVFFKDWHDWEETI